MGSVNKSYSKIKYEDGISKSEAKRIAKKSLMESEVKGLYLMTGPGIIHNPDTYPHPNYWFVSFKRKPYSLATTNYLVIVDKISNRDVC